MHANGNNHSTRRVTTPRIDRNFASDDSGVSKAIACCLVKSCPAGNLPFADLTQATTFIDFSPCTILILPCMATAKTIREAGAVAELRSILQQEATLLDKRGLSVWRLRLDALTVIGKMTKYPFGNRGCFFDRIQSQLGFFMAEFGVNAVDGVHTWNMICSDATNPASFPVGLSSTPIVTVSSSTAPLQTLKTPSTHTWNTPKTSGKSIGAPLANDSSSLFMPHFGANLFNSVGSHGGSDTTTVADNASKDATRYNASPVEPGIAPTGTVVDSSYNFLAAPLDDAAPFSFTNNKHRNGSNHSLDTKPAEVLSMAPPLFLSGHSFAALPESSASPSAASSSMMSMNYDSRSSGIGNAQAAPQQRDPNKRLLSGRSLKTWVGGGLPSTGGGASFSSLSMAPHNMTMSGGSSERIFEPSSASNNKKGSKHKTPNHHSKSRKRLRRAVYQSVKVSSALLQTHGTNYLPDELKEPSVEFTPLLKRIQAWLELHPECELRPKWVSVHPEGHKQCSAHFKCATWPCTLKEKGSSNRPDFRCPARIAVARDKVTDMYRVHYEMITHEGHGSVSNNINHANNSSVPPLAGGVEEDEDAVETTNDDNSMLAANDFTLQQNDDGSALDVDDESGEAADGDDDDNANDDDESSVVVAEQQHEFVPIMPSDADRRGQMPTSSTTGSGSDV